MKAFIEVCEEKDKWLLKAVRIFTSPAITPGYKKAPVSKTPGAVIKLYAVTNK